MRSQPIRNRIALIVVLSIAAALSARAGLSARGMSAGVLGVLAALAIVLLLSVIIDWIVGLRGEAGPTATVSNDPPAPTVRLQGWSRSAGLATLGGIVTPLATVAVYCAGQATTAAGALYHAIAGLLAGAAPLALGVAVGFVFGIPKTLQGDPSNAAAGAPQSSGPVGRASDRAIRYQVNTNLEQISDWLAKIIVGLGLTQLSTIPARIDRAAIYVQSVFGADGPSKPVAATVIVYFSIAGLAAGYLVTRLILARLFSMSDNDLNEPPPETVERVNRTALNGASVPGAPLVRMSDEDKHELLRFPLENMKTPEQFSAWGAAKLADHEPGSAVRAFQRAIAASPTGVRDPERRRATEGLMLAALYDASPAGFQRAIEAGEAYVATSGGDPAAPIYAWLACAYGQAMTWEMREGAAPDAARLATLRAKAYNAAKRAVELDPGWKLVLADTMRGSAGGDDDLAVFRSDDEFRRLLDVAAEPRE